MGPHLLNPFYFGPGMCAHGWVHALLFVMHAWMYSWYGFSLAPPPPPVHRDYFGRSCLCRGGGSSEGEMHGWLRCVVCPCVLGHSAVRNQCFSLVLLYIQSTMDPLFMLTSWNPSRRRWGEGAAHVLFTIYTTFGPFWSQHNTQSIGTSLLLVMFLFTSSVLFCLLLLLYIWRAESKFAWAGNACLPAFLLGISPCPPEHWDCSVHDGPGGGGGRAPGKVFLYFFQLLMFLLSKLLSLFTPLII
jgi:hypothetical protein